MVIRQRRRSDPRRGVTRGLGVLVCIGLFFVSLAARAELPRVMSVDHCADQYVLALAAPEQIAALSPEADDPHSYHAARAKGLPLVRPSAEVLVSLKPDVVVRYWGGGYRFLPLAERFGVKVAQIGYAVTFDAVEATLHDIAAALGVPERGETLAQEMRRRLESAAQIAAARRGAPLRAFYLTPGGATSGSGTLVHDMMIRAGLQNRGADGDRAGWYTFSLETLVMEPPDFIVASFFRMGTNHVHNWGLSHHPRLTRLLRDIPSTQVSQTLMGCPAWYAAEAVEHIARAAADMHSAEDRARRAMP